MTLLEQYEQQYASLIAEITSNISRLQQSGAERREISPKIDASLAEANELLEQIGLEIRDLPSAQRNASNSKLSCAQVELKRLQSEYRNAKERHRNQHALGYTTTIDLNAGGDADYFDDVSISNDQRQRLLENSERIERTGHLLNEGYRVAIETESVGAQVLNDLHHQRETLQNARSRLRETNADLGRASRTLNSMFLRAMREKAVLYVVGVCFVVAVGISLYLSFSSSSSASSA